jgi:hypothetical protein
VDAETQDDGDHHHCNLDHGKRNSNRSQHQLVPFQEINYTIPATVSVDTSAVNTNAVAARSIVVVVIVTVAGRGDVSTIIPPVGVVVPATALKLCVCVGGVMDRFSRISLSPGLPLFLSASVSLSSLFWITHFVLNSINNTPVSSTVLVATDGFLGIVSHRGLLKNKRL